jgi:purine-binding chemotaxis protein CheW
MQLVVFCLGEQRYALPLATVEHVVHAVFVTPLPGAPDIVLGVIDVAGTIVPVLDIRRRFLLPQREIDPAQQFVIARTAGRRVALVVDQVEEVIEVPRSAVVDADRIVQGAVQVTGVVQCNNGLVLIHDLERFLSEGESRLLDKALSEEPER